MVWSSFCDSILLFLRGNRGKPIGKIHFHYLRVRSASLTDVRVRISNKNNGGLNISKIANFGGLFFQIVHLLRLGNNGFL